MRKIPNISSGRAEEIAKAHDVVNRAKAASPVSGGKDRLDTAREGWGGGRSHVRASSDIC